MSNHEKIDPSELERLWPAPFVCRDQSTLDRATGGLVNAKTLANMDSLGKGPSGRLRLGRKVAYPRKEFFAWLAARMNPASEKGYFQGQRD